MPALVSFVLWVNELRAQLCSTQSLCPWIGLVRTLECACDLHIAHQVAYSRLCTTARENNRKRGPPERTQGDRLLSVFSRFSRWPTQFVLLADNDRNHRCGLCSVYIVVTAILALSLYLGGIGRLPHTGGLCSAIVSQKACIPSWRL